MNKRIKKKKATLSVSRIKKMILNENDVLVIECPTPVSRMQEQHMIEGLHQLFPNNKVMILPKEYKVKIITEA